ncbi:MAG: hypothetical protein JWO61_264 [Candidatus Saccharibacteria bacterium]|nr:hypothetical protein [Candidatus Saccharibacteria bacterium]
MNEFLNKNKNKLAAAAVLVAGIGGVAAHAAAGDTIENSNDKAPSSHSHEPNHELIYPVTGIDTVGGADSGWEHGAAQRALEKAVKKALTALGMTDQITDVPIYDAATTAVEMARKDGIVPDEGDKIVVFVDVTKSSDGNASIEVTGAEIKDVLNNQV